MINLFRYSGKIKESVYDTIAHLKVPDTPKILAAHARQGTIRVLFQRHPSATSWKARYKIDDNTNETPETINDFVEIPRLTLNEEYEVEIIAVNSFGESRPSKPVKLMMRAGELPPVIWHTDVQEDGFFIGYATDERDDRYQVQYGINSGDFEKFEMLQLPLKGAGYIPVAGFDVPYYYRMRRLMQWGYPSEWSHEIEVLPAENNMLVTPRGVLRDGKEAILIFEPPSKIIGLQARYTVMSTGQVHYHQIKGNRVNYIVIDDLDEHENYSFEIAAIDENGILGFVAF